MVVNRGKKPNQNWGPMSQVIAEKPRKNHFFGHFFVKFREFLVKFREIHAKFREKCRAGTGKKNGTKKEAILSDLEPEN